MSHPEFIATANQPSAWTGLVLAAAVAISACANVPQAVYHQTSIDSAHAVVVVGVALEDLPPRGRVGLVLDGYAASTKKTMSYPFSYESANGPPQSATSKYFVYRVPAGAYRVSLDAVALPVAKTFDAPAGQAVYVGDFALVPDAPGFELRNNLSAAQQAVAALLPDGLPLVKAN